MYVFEKRAYVMYVESLIAIHSERNIPMLKFSSVNPGFGQEKVSQFISGE